MKHVETKLDHLTVCKHCATVKPAIGWGDEDCPTLRKCTRCGIMSNQVGFPECYTEKDGWHVSHDMKEVKDDKSR